MCIIRVLFIILASVSVCVAQNDSNKITVKDADGNVYTTVKIGNQVWTVENLRTTKYNDGTPITKESEIDYLLDDDLNMIGDTTAAYCYYENTTDTGAIIKYGALYNWYAVQAENLAPAGWHVPDTTDWNILTNYLIANGYNWDGTTSIDKTAKSLATKTDWESWDEEGAIGTGLAENNKSGFSALPGGYFSCDSYVFFRMTNDCCMWSSTQCDDLSAFCRILRFDSYYLGALNDPKNNYYSVRLVKD